MYYYITVLDHVKNQYCHLSRLGGAYIYKTNKPKGVARGVYHV